MDPLERSVVIRQEADYVLAQVGLFESLAICPRVILHGSYYLDVMIYPDIDLYISKLSIEQVLTIGIKLAKRDRVRAIVFEKSSDPEMGNGLYLKARVDHGEWGRLWKIDIWSLDDNIIDQKMGEMKKFKDKLTPALREQIIQYKASIMTPQKRTPMYSGYFIYKAFLDEGLTDHKQVSAYLRKNGIDL